MNEMDKTRVSWKEAERIVEDYTEAWNTSSKILKILRHSGVSLEELIIALPFLTVRLILYCGDGEKGLKEYCEILLQEGLLNARAFLPAEGEDEELSKMKVERRKRSGARVIG
jgi:hypothetical protein